MLFIKYIVRENFKTQMVRENHKKRRKEFMKDIQNNLTKRFPLNLQMFAEGGEGGDGGGGGKENPPAPKYSDDDYLKLKGNFDKTASELAELKKQLKAKLTDEEKKAEEEKAKENEFLQMKKELETMKVKSKLAGAFDEKEVEDISSLILEGDIAKLVDKLVETRKAFETKIREEAKKEFQKSSNLPGGGGAGGDDVPELVKDYIDQNKAKGKNAKDYWLGNNDNK